MAERNWTEVKMEDGEMWDRQSPLEGEFIESKTDQGPNKSTIYVVKTETGNVKFWGSTVLDDKMMGVPQGAYIKVEYEGLIPSKKGTKYHGYKVFFDPDTVLNA